MMTNLNHISFIAILLLIGPIQTKSFIHHLSYHSTTYSFLSSKSKHTGGVLSLGVFSSDGGNEEEEWINPFEQAKSLGKTRRSVPDVTNISLRQMKMNELVSSLLRVVNDDQAMENVLTENANLLMEPFSDEYDPKLDQDSIYSEGMNREEKLKKYDAVMEDRIKQANSEQARIILNAMRTFVLDYDEK